MYEVAPHPDFNFKAGDTVLRLAAPGRLHPNPNPDPNPNSRTLALTPEP